MTAEEQMIGECFLMRRLAVAAGVCRHCAQKSGTDLLKSTELTAKFLKGRVHGVHNFSRLPEAEYH